jgi:ubiquinone/menaquinone biosynthesis C-methylase UbiE
MRRVIPQATTEAVGDLAHLALCCFIFVAFGMASVRAEHREHSSAAWSGSAQLYASSLGNIPGSISIAASKLLRLENPIQKLTFVDVASGPGVLSMEVLERMGESKLGGKVIVTDFAPGMIDAAKARVEAVRESGNFPTGVDVECTVMDGQALALPDASATHVGCMFGIMFYPDVAKGLRELRRILVPGGRCVVGTWRDAGAAHVTNDFAAYLGLPSASGIESEAVAKLMRVAEIGKDPKALTDDLYAAGFSSVEIHAVPTTYRTSDWLPFLAMMRTNPAMGQFLAPAPADTDWEAEWKTFLTTDGASKYLRNGVDLEVQWLANVAVASA